MTQAGLLKLRGYIMHNVSYDFKEGQLIKLHYGRPIEAWDIYHAPTEELRNAIAWNDRNGDFEEL